MDGQQLLKAAEFHRSFLSHTGVTPVRADQNLLNPTLEQAFAHTLFMTETVPLFVAEGRTQKAMRWICFTQGVLWDRGLVASRVLKEVMSPPRSLFDPRA